MTWNIRNFLNSLKRNFEFAFSLRNACVVITWLRGFYCTTVNWVPYVGQNILFKREYNNKHDRIDVAGKTLLKGRIAPITFGHVLRELSRHTWYTWYAVQEGAQFEATVHNTKARP